MQKSAALTDALVRNAKPEVDRQFEIWDGRVSGFGLRVSPSGTKAFVLVYRHAGRPKRMTLGRYPDLSLAEARSRAFEAKGMIASGIDPKPAKPVEESRDHSFVSVVGDFIERHAKRKTRSWQQTEQILHREFVSVLGKQSIEEIEKRDVARILDGIVDRGSPSAANHAFRIIRKFFNWCVEQGLVDVSPVMGLKPPAKSVDRDRVLSDNEVARIWIASDQVPYPYGTIVKLLLLTGQRRDEVVSMRRDELDLDNAHWTIAAERTKNGKPNEVPLSPQAVQLLRDAPEWVSEFVFPARGRPERSFSGFSKSKKALDAASGVTDWRLHDLRRTLATGLARLGTDPHVVEHILNHQTGTLSQVARIYNRHSYLPEKREALCKWADHIEGIVAKARTAESAV
ncbi:tyrosine-type recombinase/integrase [Oricola indica]|uniref:tyrosine-type recombinase/integrase n=1 Tax=Oricola indica TaxID=2872591 RepID=UPI003CCC14A9